VAEREDVGEADGLTFLEMSWRFERAMAERPRFSALAEGSLEGSGVLSRETSAMAVSTPSTLTSGIYLSQIGVAWARKN
jgi:hypothetical protein